MVNFVGFRWLRISFLVLSVYLTITDIKVNVNQKNHSTK